jgi:hypothetical protein
MEEGEPLVAPPAAGHESTFQGSFPRGLSVLVVDDDALCLKLVERMLSTAGYGGGCEMDPLPLSPSRPFSAELPRARLPLNARGQPDRPLRPACSCGRASRVGEGGARERARGKAPRRRRSPVADDDAEG